MTALESTVSIKNAPAIVFTDFDGTITEVDCIRMVMEGFEPEGWKAIVDKIINKQLNLGEGVQALFNLFKAEDVPTLQQFIADHVKIRAGFDRFLTYCQGAGIPVVVVSGGVDFIIEPVLKPYRDKILALHCNNSDLSSQTIVLSSDVPPIDCVQCNNCSCCKQQVMTNVIAELALNKEITTIAIGDSLSDIGMMQKADVVFARHKLLDYAKDHGVETIAFTTFDDITTRLEALLADKVAG